MLDTRIADELAAVKQGLLDVLKVGGGEEGKTALPFIMAHHLSIDLCAGSVAN